MIKIYRLSGGSFSESMIAGKQALGCSLSFELGSY